MNKIFSILLVFGLLTQFTGFGQDAPGSIIPGRMMVQLTDLETLENMKSAFGQADLRVERILSYRLRIALLSYDHGRMAPDALLGEVRKLPFILNAQHEHVVELRAAREDTLDIPNDDFFDLQWSLHNTGQNNGLPGADIDAIRAWEITKGGLTAHGDTIVVAVIDGGCDINHPDLMANLFKNWNEIPGNGIDDDGNGYIDDFHGWNAYNNSGNVPSHAHGSHVIGTVGAASNNEIGVVGVNWNVKVMPIAGSSGFESTVVAAYSYAYDMRALYDETNGEKGAFIVATNSSFGVDQGNPQNFPIWGAMYDSMGALGILSAAATANRNWNIDEMGDMPTSHPSPYIISVTNTTNMDVKTTQAGYGIEAIDLGAPGTNIYSTRPNNTYGFSSGTSMATPHVAGAIALLLSAADSAFIAYYKAEPAKAAADIKHFILEGTDKLESLEGLVATGGRLNVYNSIMLMLNGELPPSLPNLKIEPETKNISLYPDDTISAMFAVVNISQDTAWFNIHMADTISWLTFEPESAMIAPGDTIDIHLSINAFEMEAGDYVAELNIDTEHNQQLIFTLNLNVKNLPPFMVVLQDTIRQHLIIQSDTLRHFYIRNDGGEPLMFSLQMFTEIMWLTTEPGEGTVSPADSVAVELMLSSFGLEPALYQAELLIKTDHGQADTLLIEMLVFNPESVSEQAARTFSSIFPNPSDGNVLVTINAQPNQHVRLIITALDGRQLLEKQMQASADGIVKWNWDGTSTSGKAVENGIYFYIITSGESTSTGKILIQR